LVRLRREVESAVASWSFALELLAEALTRIESGRIGLPLLLLEGGVVEGGEVSRCSSVELLARWVQSETKTNGWVGRLEGARRWRVRLFYMMMLMMSRRRRAPTLALLIHDLCDDAEIEIVGGRGSFQVSPSGTVAEQGGCAYAS
jgi:hypothetical protein